MVWNARLKTLPKILIDLDQLWWLDTLAGICQQAPPRSMTLPNRHVFFWGARRCDLLLMEEIRLIVPLSQYRQGFYTYYTSQVVQDFFHQQYVSRRWKPIIFQGGVHKPTETNSKFASENRGSFAPKRAINQTQPWIFGVNTLLVSRRVSPTYHCFPHDPKMTAGVLRNSFWTKSPKHWHY